MKKKLDEITYYFVDESGDPYFYNRRGEYIVGDKGSSKILLLGFIRTKHPQIIRQAMWKLSNKVKNDQYLKNIPSVSKSIRAFHAKDDCPEVREKVFKEILKLPFKAEIYVARKIKSVFKVRHKGRPNIFYDDLISKLFQNKLHTSSENHIYFAVRGNRARQKPLEEAILKAKLNFEEKWQMEIDGKIDIFPQRAESEPCLSVIDYVNWAVQRAFCMGDDRYMNFVSDKLSLIVDLYDFSKYPKNFYSKKNKFELNKISPL